LVLPDAGGAVGTADGVAGLGAGVTVGSFLGADGTGAAGVDAGFVGVDVGFVVATAAVAFGGGRRW
jgi:hypothetical protein